MSSLPRTEQVRVIFEDQLERCELSLPLLPKVAAMVIQLSSEEDADARQLAKLIQSDMALAGHVMRIANSPIYRPVTPFVSLQQAIARLGLLSIGEIALATSLSSDLFEAPGQEALLKGFWHDSLMCSGWARELARLRRTNVESSFLAGLLCQMGRPVVVQGLTEFQLDNETLFGLVNDYSIRAGAILARIWKLPDFVGQTIIAQVETDYEGPFEDVVINVQAALEMLRHPGDPQLSEAMLDRLNLYPKDVDKLLEKQALVTDWVKAVEV